MARFKAYSTDSEDESDNTYSSSEDGEAQKPRQESGDRSDSDASVVEAHLLPPRRRGTSSMIVDDDGDESDDSNAERDKERKVPTPATRTKPRSKRTVQLSDPAVLSPKPASRAARKDPSVIPRAREAGVDAQTMHVKQAALFKVPAESATLKGILKAPEKRQKGHAAGINERKHARDSDGEPHSGARQRASFEEDIEPAPYTPSRKYARVDIFTSNVSGSEGAYVDAGLALGRSFRPGWGPGGLLVHVGALCGPSDSPKTTANTSIVFKRAIPLAANDVSKTAPRLLSYQLEQTKINPDAEGVPLATPSDKLTFTSFATQYPATERSFEACLFRLGRALFDPVELRFPDAEDAKVREGVLSLRRKAALSKWLQETIQSTVDAELRENPDAHWAATVFTLLTGNQVERACEVALDKGNPRLASIIAQVPGDASFRRNMLRQVRIWQEQKVDVHICEETRKVYALAAGIVDVLEGSKGTGIEQCPDIDIAKGLSWKRAFGLQLWYGKPMDATVADTFKAFEASWKKPSSGVTPPRPWYAEQASMQSSAQPDSATDAMYSFLKLYADPELSLSDVLQPLSFSPCASDYRLPWHLYILFARCLRVRDLADHEKALDVPLLGYEVEPSDQAGSGGEAAPTAAGTSLGEGAQDNAGASSTRGASRNQGHSPSADLLANSYALQLEQAGMIQEAAFVLLHIGGSAGRKKAIKDLLGRNATKLDDWNIRGLVGSLKIPMTWINEAQGEHALSKGEVFAAYELFLKAGLYADAHQLAVSQLAPDAVIREDLNLLRDLFDKIKGHPVLGWQLGGKVFLDYVDAMARLHELQKRSAAAGGRLQGAESSELEQLARSVPKLIGVLPSVLRDQSDPRHRVALEQMTLKLTTQMERVRPLTIYQSQMRPSSMSEGDKLQNIRTAALEKFSKTIESA
ncbi:hypothetical protein WOLCODRAFT_139791 [Wolfiporia cocos MD-104 SS10]|uniref:Nuclear pore complex protein NUP96 C-terminal domain-containing protein n=1 Tax=Wolfiporia cocos (strain MD-104) TaxID=742152 RepID=A0A2H3J602_WOLCO|nr:hypothetical protein WOLCODRAFT_139791 [Wolfiporia cocos MD-104 SS10]